jgi:hypothetical protein
MTQFQQTDWNGATDNHEKRSPLLVKKTQNEAAKHHKINIKYLHVNDLIESIQIEFLKRDNFWTF